MSNTYTNRMKEIVIYFIEEGELKLKEIAEICNVSLKFVRKVRDNYDVFYVGLI